MKYYLLQLSASFLKPYVLVAVSASSIVLLRPSKLSICLKVWLMKSPTDMVPMPSSFTDCQLLAQVKLWVLWVVMVLVKQQLSRFCQVILSQTWETTNNHLHGKTSLSFSEEVNCKITSQNFLKTILKLLSRLSILILLVKILSSLNLL